MNKFKCVKDNLLHGFVYLKNYDRYPNSFWAHEPDSILLGLMCIDVDRLVYTEIEENLEFLYFIKRLEDLL